MKLIKSRILNVWVVSLALVGAVVVAPASGAAPAVKVKAINFPLDRQVEVPMQGSPKAPDTVGQANVEPKSGGAMEIEGNFRGLKSPSTFGPEYLVYVMWAVTPDGTASNLGPIRMATYPEGKGECRGTTRFPAFAIAVTAEPHFAVTRPSDTVVAINGVPDKKYIQTVPVELNAELLERARYQAAGLKPVTVDPKVPIELYQARNAVQIARWQKAGEFAKDSLDKATKALERAEAAQKAPKPDAEAVVMAARESVQAAEDARNVAAVRDEEARLAAERKAAADREAAARAVAEAEATKRAAAQAETAGVKSEVEKRRADLLARLNTVLATKDTERGLVATMADVNFATGSAELLAPARETLARLAGIVSLLPKLEFVIEGYTDDVGSDASNQTLSERRAQSVREYLVGQGIPAINAKSKGLGEASPVASNADPDGRAKNRRVEIVLGGEVIGTKLRG